MQAQRVAFDRILTQTDGELGQRPGSILLDGATISAIETAPSGSSGFRLALPAPCNAHDHGRGMRTIAFGAPDDALEVWIARLGLEPIVDPYLRAAVAFGRMACSGMAAVNHCHNSQTTDLVTEARAVSRASRDVGIRVAFAVPVSGRNPITYGDPEPLLSALPSERRAAARERAATMPSFESQIALIDELAAFEHPLFTLQYGPIGPQWVEDAALAEIARRSAEDGRRVHMHLLETRHQREWADVAYPQGIVQHLDALGLLSPRLTLAHGVWLTPAECDLLAARGVTVSVNTSSNLRLRSGIAPVRQFIASGLRFGLGLDGMAFDDDEDVMREIRMLWHLQRGFGVEDVMDRARLFRAVFVDGRYSILGEDGGGSLTSGAPADFVVLDTEAIEADVIGGRADLLDLVLSRATKAQVAELYVAGRQVVKDGRLMGFDLAAAVEALIGEAREKARAIDLDLERRIGAAYAQYHACGCHKHLSKP